jgi:hypothetical protein
MAHADMNAAIQAASRGPVEHAVVYLPMPPCENCLLVFTNLRLAGIQVKRIVYLENRDFPNTNWLMKFIPHVVLQPYTGPNPLDVLMNAAIYMKLRQEVPDKLSANSAKTYSGGS